MQIDAVLLSKQRTTEETAGEETARLNSVCVNVEACESRWKVFLCCYRLHTEHPVCPVRRILTQPPLVSADIGTERYCTCSREMCACGLDCCPFLFQQGCLSLPLAVQEQPLWTCLHCTFSCVTSVLSEILRLLLRFRFFLRHRAKIDLSSLRKWSDWVANYCRRKLLKILTLLCFL